MNCIRCGSPTKRAADTCQPCYNYLKKHPEGFPTTMPPYGVLVRNDKDEVQCHVCGLFYSKLGGHIRQKHNMSIIEYKDTYGIYHGHSLCGEKYITKMRKYTKKYYRRVVKKNLLKHGKKTRYMKGQKVIGRGKHIKKD